MCHNVIYEGVLQISSVMIISHKYKFIFIKTKKVAGTSIERILHPLLGDDDIHTRLYWESVDSKNCPQKTIEHAGWEFIQRNYPDAWNNYYKFTIERNPWDKVVSGWYFWKGVKPEDPACQYDTFSEYLLDPSRETVGVQEWKQYTDNDKIVVDQVLEFNNLHNEFQEVCNHLNIPYHGELAHVNEKTGYKDFKGYRHQYTAASREKVARLFQKEIEYFGYTF